MLKTLLNASVCLPVMAVTAVNTGGFRSGTRVRYVMLFMSGSDTSLAPNNISTDATAALQDENLTTF